VGRGKSGGFAPENIRRFEMFVLRKVFRRVVEKVKVIKEVVRTNPLLLGVLLVPLLAPHTAPIDLAYKVVNLGAIFLGCSILIVGGIELIKGQGSLLSRVLSVFLMVAGGSFLATGSLRIFEGNTLGEIIYDLFVQFFIT
jgi:hypothetical protein